MDSTTEGDDADALSEFCRDELEGLPHSQNLVASRNQYESRNIIINPYYRDFPKGRYFAENSHVDGSSCGRCSHPCQSATHHNSSPDRAGGLGF